METAKGAWCTAEETEPKGDPQRLSPLDSGSVGEGSMTASVSGGRIMVSGHENMLDGSGGS